MPLLPDIDSLVRLDGKGVVVLGSGGDGIGTQVARTLAAGGARVLCVDVDGAEAERVATETGGTAFLADVTDRAQVEAVFARAVELYGDDFHGFVDVVGTGPHGPLETFDDAGIDSALTMNLKHAILATQVAGPLLADRGAGSMVFISSLAGDVVSPGHSLYGIAKAGLQHLARYAADEFGPAGVRANAIGTGLILTEGMLAVVEPAVIAQVTSGIPMRRVGLPQDIASAVYFLMSPLASYVTGSVLHVEGGNMVGSRGFSRDGMAR